MSKSNVNWKKYTKKLAVSFFFYTFVIDSVTVMLWKMIKEMNYFIYNNLLNL